MKDIHLFVEDKTQMKFLVDFIAERFGYNFPYHPEKKAGQFYNTYGGWNEWVNMREAFKEKSTNNITNLLFADADIDANKRRAQIISLNEKENLEFKLFLFPDDNRKGNIETLLEEIYQPKKFIECYQKMEACVSDKNGFLPASKTKIYTLSEIVTSENEREKDLHKDPHRNYRNENWNLNAPVLNSLYQFLQPYFQ